MESDLSISHLFNVKGLVVVISGGGSGLGSYAARGLAANGAKAVYVLGRREDALRKVAAYKPDVIKPLVCDVSDRESIAAAAAHVRAAEGYVNAVFANAGITGPMVSEALPNPDPSIEEFQAAMMKVDMAKFTETFHVNVTAVFYTAVAFLDLLDAGNKKGNVAQRSQVLVTSSIGGFIRKMAAGYAYSSSKAAVTHLAKLLSTNLAPYAIRFNIVAPGIYVSEMTDGMIGGADDHKHEHGGADAFPGAKALPAAVSPAGRSGTERDFASSILFLLSPAGAYLDGNVLVTDGGRIGQQPATY